MDLKKELQQITANIDEPTFEFLKTNEEATKTALILPFFSALGYNIFNPMEVVPEYTADVGIKKGEKVDYAICIDNKPQLLIEAKAVGDKLQNHDSQLFRYFSTTDVKFAILTNGLDYWLYTDLEKDNVMDESPFYQFNIQDLKDNDVIEISKLHRNEFDPEKLFRSAEKLKYLDRIKAVIEKEFASPSDDFVKLVLNQGVHDGIKTPKIVDKCRPILKQAIDTTINERLDKRLRHALENTEDVSVPDQDPVEDETVEEGPSKELEIETTQFELQCFYTVQAILSEFIPSSDIAYRDNTKYFNILYQDSRIKWLCRIYEKKSVTYVIFPTSDGQEDRENRVDISTPEDIYMLKDRLIDALKMRLVN